MAGTPRTSVSDATEADIRADMAELMQASNFGAPTEAQQWGLTTQPQGKPDSPNSSLAELELQADIAKQQAANFALQSLAPNQIPQADESEHWKRLYGQGENEKGELRRQLEEANRQRAEQTELMNQLLSAMQTPNYGPQVNYGGRPQFMPTPYVEPRNPLADRDENDVLSVRDIRKLIEEEVKPNFNSLYMQTMQLMDQQTAASRRAAAGITPLEEFQLTRENPWLASLATEAQRVDAMASLKKMRAQTTQAAQTVAQQVQTQTAQQVGPVIRRLTTVEQATQQAPDLSGDALTAAFNRDLALARQLPEENGARAKAMRTIAAKYNIPVGQMSDMGLMRSQVIT